MSDAAHGEPEDMEGQTYEWTSADLKELEDNYVEEVSATWLYESLAGIEERGDRQKWFKQLSEYERLHAEAWKRFIERVGHHVPGRTRKLDHRVLFMLAKVFGVGAVIPILHRSEIDGVANYKKQKDRWKDPFAQDTLAKVIPDEVSHEVDLFREMRRESATAGGLRSIILGANDGMGSILALVAGVAGATFSNIAVIIAGAAGLVSGAVSMAASSYISVKAEQEIYSSQIQIEGDALDVAPETKRAQLREAYKSKGLTDQEADTVVTRLSERREVMLKTILNEQYGISEASIENPLRLSLYTGIAFILAGLIPVLPFLFLPTVGAVIAAVIVTCTALFFAGVIRSLSTLKPFLRSGVEMVLIGTGAAAVTYLIGFLIGGVIG